jgi:hypothetical protein
MRDKDMFWKKRGVKQATKAKLVPEEESKIDDSECGRNPLALVDPHGARVVGREDSVGNSGGMRLPLAV